MKPSKKAPYFTYLVYMVTTRTCACIYAQACMPLHIFTRSRRKEECDWEERGGEDLKTQAFNLYTNLQVQE